MTAHGHASPGTEAASHDHHYEGTPADRLGPGEPSTPLWLPLVGLGLILIALFGYVVTRPAAKTSAELTQEASPTGSAPAAPAASVPPPGFRRMPGMPSVFIPNAPPGAGARPTAAQPMAPQPMVPRPSVSVVQKPFTKPGKRAPAAPAVPAAPSPAPPPRPAGQ